MKFDRNNVIGFIVLGLLFIGFFYFNSKEQNLYLAEKRKQEEKKRVKDSTKRAQDSIINYRSNPTPTTATQDTGTATAADSAGFLQALKGT